MTVASLTLDAGSNTRSDTKHSGATRTFHAALAATIIIQLATS